MTGGSVATESGIEIDAGCVAEWVGLHYGRNFASEPEVRRKEWIERFAESHGLRLINTPQELVLRNYAGGEFSHILECKTKADLDAEVGNCHDGLLRFLMVELATSEDCTDLEDGHQRVSRAIAELQDVLAIFEADLAA